MCRGAASIVQIALDSLGAAGSHHLSEIVDVYASGAADNGSAFAGLNGNMPWWKRYDGDCDLSRPLRERHSASGDRGLAGGEEKGDACG